MRKRILALLLTLVMLVGMLPTVVLAAEPEAAEAAPAAAQITTSLDGALDSTGAYETDEAQLTVTVEAVRGGETLTPLVMFNGDMLFPENGAYTLRFAVAGSQVLRIAVEDAQREITIIYMPKQAAQSPAADKPVVEAPAMKAPAKNAPAAQAAGTNDEADKAEAGNPASVTVSYTAQAAGEFLVAPQLNVTVSGDLAESYGFTDRIDSATGVSALDVLVAAHEVMFGKDDLLDAYDGDYLDEYLAVSDEDAISTLFGEETASVGFFVNDAIPRDGNTWHNVANCPVQTGDTLTFFIYQDTTGWSDQITWFTQADTKLTALTGISGETAEVTLVGQGMSAKSASAVSGVQLAWVNIDTGETTEISGAVTDESGKASITLKSGTAYLTAKSTGSTYVLGPVLKVQGNPAMTPDADGIYKIATAKELVWFANAINSGEIDQKSNAALTADINLAGIAFTPIGTTDLPYKGVFDGANKSITGLTVNTTGTLVNSGMFGTVQAGTIKNLTVSGTVTSATNGSYKGRDYVSVYTGGIVGYLKSGTVTNCVSNVTVTGQKSEYVGGVVGGCYYVEEISNCTNNGSVTGRYAGGIVGYAYGPVKNCKNTGTVFSSLSAAGGIAAVAKINAKISNCTNSGNVTLETDNSTSLYLGGICAYIEKVNTGIKTTTSVTECTNTGTLYLKSTIAESSNYPFIGGIIGYSDYADNRDELLISDCRNSGSVTLDKVGNQGASVGGIIGEAENNKYRILDCLNTGAISGYCKVGGIAGDLRGENTASTDKSAKGPYISGCGNTGSITVKAIDGENASLENHAVGGLVGRAEQGLQVADSYNTGSITSAARNVGGLIGRVAPGRDEESVVLTGCYATGTITSAAENVGALLGKIDHITSTEPGIITSSELYYKPQTGLNEVGSGANESVKASAAATVEDILSGSVNFVKTDDSAAAVTPAQAGFTASAVTELRVDTSKARTLRYDKGQAITLDTKGIDVKAVCGGKTYTVGHGLVTFDTSAVKADTDGQYPVTVKLGSKTAQFHIFIGEIRLSASFTVLDAVSNQPVAGAAITVTNQADTAGTAIAANADGSYTLAPGTYSYTVTAAGYQTRSGSFEVTSYGGNPTISVTLVPVFAVRFTVKNEDGSTVEGASVTVLSGKTEQTPSQGVYYLPNGDYTYTVRASGYTTIQDGTFKVNGEALTVDVTLKSYNASVYFALYGDTVHDGSTTHHLWDTTKEGKMQTWIALKEVPIEDGWTVGDVFKTVLDEAGYKYQGADDNYVRQITSPENVKIGEFTAGKQYDGWQYRINGEYVNVGLNEKLVSNGDVIVWFYCDNYGEEGSIQLVSAPSKTDYAVGETLQTAGMRVNYLGNSGVSGGQSTTDVTSKVTLSGFDSSKTGTQRVFVNYGGYTASFVVTVAAGRTVTSLTIQSQPQKLAYEIGEALSLDGMKVKASYSDGSSAVIANADLLVTGFDSTTAGEKTVTVSYGGKKATFTVTVKAAQSALTWQQALEDVLTYIKSSVPDPSFGSVGGEWSVLTLARGGMEDRSYTDAYYAKVAAYVKEQLASVNDGSKLDKNKSTDNSRLILALTAIGKDATNVDGVNLVAPLISDNAWVNKQGINGPIWALIALDSKPYKADASVRETLVSAILAKELAAGGWSYFGTEADSDMTGMAIQALAPYYKTNAAVKAAVDKAVIRLSEMQASTGGFSTMGDETVESAAQIVVALSAIGIDANEDGRFVKNGTGAVDAMLRYADTTTGGFKHVLNKTVNAMATDQAGYALVAYSRFKAGKTSLYDMSDVQKREDADAQEVIGMINAIGTVNESSYNAIAEARNAYDQLSAADKEKVKNYNTLTAGEAAYKTILSGKQSTQYKQLKAHYDGLLNDKTKKYSTAAKKKLQSILDKAQSDMNAAKSCERVMAIYEKAVSDLDAVKPGDMEVTFRLIGALEATQDVDLTSNSYLPEYVTWVPTTTYALQQDATVYDLFTEAMSDAGLRYIGAESNYVSTIYAPSCLGGYALSEFTNGKKSGWMYTVNGTHPNQGLKNWTLKDGDVVIWHYVNDYSHEVADWFNDPSYPALGNGTYYNGWLRAADITPERYVEQLLGKIVTVGKHGTVEPKLKLSDIGKSVTFTFKPDKGYRVKDVKVDGKSVGAVTTYTVSKLTVSTRIEVEFTDGKLPFTDVLTSDWFYEDVAFVYNEGLFAGTSDTTFSPNAAMTRAMLVTVLYRLEGKPAVSGRSGVSDVTLNSYYEDAVTWAANNGIVNGTSDTMFSPNANVTREQMAAILYRYAQYKKYNTAASSSLNGFSDHTAVSSYAVTPLQWAVAEKLVNGTAGKLMPTGNATRAQVAAILHRFVENVATTK